LRAHTAAEAARVLDTVVRWQARFVAALGRRLVYAADEYYLLAGRPFPGLADYDGLPQHENGVGMARQFEHEVRAAAGGRAVAGAGPRAGFFAWVDGAPAAGYRATRTSCSPGAGGGSVGVRLRTGRPVALLTGEYGARVLEPLVPTLREVTGTDVRTVAVANRFFGGNIAVTGLLTGADLAAALAREPAGDRYLLPDVVLSGDRFLDGATVTDLPRPVEVVGTDGASLVAALRG
jgi:NifB/MoaA-like Fe-S oxidoreductase